DREAGARICGSDSAELPHVAGQAGDAEQSRTLIEELREFKDAMRGVILVHLQDVNEQSGIQIAGPRPHDDSAGRRQAHGGVDRKSVEDSGDAGSVPEMRDDQAARDIFLKGMKDGFAREPMKAIAADSISPKFAGKREARGGFRQCAVERGVKAGEL